MKLKYKALSLILCCLILCLPVLELTAQSSQQTPTCTHVHTSGCYITEKNCRHECSSECEGGCRHECSEKDGCITKLLACTHVHSSECGYTDKTSGSREISAWEFEDTCSYLAYDENSGEYLLALPGANKETPVTESILDELLPDSINATLTGGEKITLPIRWDLSPIPPGGIYEGSCTLTGSVEEVSSEEVSSKKAASAGGASQKSYYIKENVPALRVTLELGAGSTYAYVDESLRDHVLEGVTPSNVKINLFDYGIESVTPYGYGDRLAKEPLPHNLESSKDPKYFAGPGQFNMGINKNRLLIFGDSVAHAGLWNMDIGEKSLYSEKHGVLQGICETLLDGGFPALRLKGAQDLLYGEGLKPLYNWEDISDYLLAGEHTGTGITAYPYGGANPQNISKTLISNWENATGKNITSGSESLSYLFDSSRSDSKENYLGVGGLLRRNSNGYYYYSSKESFAELDRDSGSFILYDAPGVVGTNGIAEGFFPFNAGIKVFDEISAEDGSLQSSLKSTYSLANAGSGYINHYFGMTMNIDFRQAKDGQIATSPTSKQNMIFEISSDDDVWVYVDDVLVLDMGGVHTETTGKIDFATGIVEIKNTAGNVTFQRKLSEIFRDAGRYPENKKGWREETFANNTEHTLKMFRLERDGEDSVLSVRFNLAPQELQQIKKVNQDGAPLSGVGFSLYPAKKEADGTYVRTSTTPLITLTTNEKGIAYFAKPGSESEENPNGLPISFGDLYSQGIEYYILEETKPPEGYRPPPIDVVLKYNPETTMLTVDNPWTTGAYASFNSSIVSNSNTAKEIIFDEKIGDLVTTNKNVGGTTLTNSIIAAVPMLLEKESGKWKALYGSNTTGYKTAIPSEMTSKAWREAILTALLYQCSTDGVPDWYLTWQTTELSNPLMVGELIDLPGRSDRYLLNNPDEGDMKMVYAYISSSYLRSIGININASYDGKYDDLGKYIREYMAKNNKTQAEAIEYVRTNILSADSYFRLIDTDDFNRSFRTSILIPNEQRELHVMSVDENQKSRNGAEFTLYSDKECKNPVATGITADVNGRKGTLIFTPSPKRDENGQPLPGYAEVSWVKNNIDTYYLKETKPPEGCLPNEAVTPVHVGVYSVYADAGDSDNDITVMAGVGKLVETMKKYAADEEVNITLRDITAYARVQKQGEFKPDGWSEMYLSGTTVPRSMNLHYNKNAIVEYGLHSEDGGEQTYPCFVTDTGFISVRIKQNYAALSGEKYNNEGSNNSANKEDLKDTDITPLFRLINTVVVKSPAKEDTDTGSLIISKELRGANISEEDYNRNFKFKLTLTNGNGDELTEQFYYYGNDKAGYLKSGDILLLHHDENIILSGLTANTKYTVTEIVDEESGYTPVGGNTRRGTVSSDKDKASPERADFINAPEAYITPFSFIKVDGMDNTIPLPGAHFALYIWQGEGEAPAELLPLRDADSDGKWRLISAEVSKEDGEVKFDLVEEGIYRLIETEAPGGYILPKAQWQFAVSFEGGHGKIGDITVAGAEQGLPPALASQEIEKDGITYEVYILPNMPAVKVPVTGGIGRAGYTALGSALICTAAAIVWYTTRCTAPPQRKHKTKAPN